MFTEEIRRRIEDSYEVENNVLNAVPQPLVSIRTSTYNHGKYIRQCIEGILMQKTSFPFEYIIGEDCSTDQTREIVMEYAAKYPDIIRVVTADYNVGMKANGERCIMRCRGKYMALCEGDDYWIDPLKLQKQVDYLEAHPQCSMSYTEAVIINEDPTKKVKRWRKGVTENFCEHLMIKGNPVVTASVLIRMNVYQEFMREQSTYDIQMKMGDVPLWIYAAKDHPVHHMDDKTVAYRVLANSASHSPDPEKVRAFFQNSLDIKLYMNRRYNIGVSEKKMWRGFYKGVLQTMCGYSRKHMWEAVKEVAVKSPLAFFDPKVMFYLVKRCILNK